MTDEIKHNGCNCTLCENNRSHAKHILLIPAEQRPYFETVYDDLLNTKADLDYYHAIMEGSWPSSIGILEQALERAKLKQKERDDNAAS